MTPPTPAAKNPTVVDLVGQRVEAVLRDCSVLPEREQRITATLVYLRKSWLGLTWTYRGRRHLAHVPLGSVVMIKQATPIRRTGTSR